MDGTDCRDNNAVSADSDIFRMLDDKRQNVQRLAETEKPLFRKALLELRRESGKIEYSRGDSGLPRGFYNPSPVADIVSPKASRGELCNADSPGCSYRYIFNSELVLTVATRLFRRRPLTREILISDRDGIVRGAAFSGGRLAETSECVFRRHRVISYSYLILNPNSGGICPQYSYHREEFAYSPVGLSEALVFDLLRYPDSPRIYGNRYVFVHDAEGYITGGETYIYDPVSGKYSFSEQLVLPRRVRR